MITCFCLRMIDYDAKVVKISRFVNNILQSQDIDIKINIS